MISEFAQREAIAVVRHLRRTKEWPVAGSVSIELYQHVRRECRAI